jgi:hypothetical protein
MSAVLNEPRKASVLAVPLRLRSGGARLGLQPVTWGVPWPKGSLGDVAAAQLRFGDATREVQTETLARWPDGSIKWLLCDALLDLAESQKITDAQLIIDRSGDAPTLMSLAERGASVAVDTGSHRLLIDAASPVAFATLISNEMEAALQFALDLSIDNSLRSITWSPPDIETHGSLRTSVSLRGVVQAYRHLQVHLRLTAFSGTSLLRCDATLHNTRAAQHRGGLWDLGDEGSQFFDDLSLRVTTNRGWLSGELKFDGGEVAQRFGRPKLSLIQYSSGGENWQSPNHVDRSGRVPLKHRGYRLDVNGESRCGLRAAPTIALGKEEHGLAAALPEFWQTFPKALTVDERSLRFGLFPREHGAPHELQGGERKRHTVWFQCSDEAADLDWVHAQASISAAPEWHAGSHAWPYFGAQENELPPAARRILSAAAGGPSSLLAKREAIDEYGWRNYGDVWADHEQDYYRGEGPVISHYNNQFDLLYGSLVLWLTGEDERWWQIADPLARHIADIDVYHTREDRAAFCGGLFWHTDHYVAACTATHRTYSRHNGGEQYGGGPSNEHNYAAGLAHYYYLTGDPGAREAVISLAEWIIAADDGRRSRWRWLDAGPTGLASRTYEDNYHGPGRGAGNSLQVLVDAWELTGQCRYLSFAETLIRRCIHPHDDIDARELLKAEQRWSYTVFLVALDRYLLAKEAADDCDDCYAYARASLLAYARWMLDRERPYFDRRDQLQYITETWPAQDLRKANVLRFASRYADASLAAKLNAKADEISSIAYGQILSFPNFHSARAVSIVAMELIRAATAGELPRTEAPAEEAAFGEPQVFESSVARIKRRLKSPAGWLRLGTNALRELFAVRVKPSGGKTSTLQAKACTPTD